MGGGGATAGEGRGGGPGKTSMATSCGKKMKE